MVPLVEVQSSRTQRPTAGTSYPYVDLTLGDMNTQRVIQLQLEQVLHIQEPCSEASQHFQWSAVESVKNVSLSTGPRAVSSHCHAGKKHDVFAG